MLIAGNQFGSYEIDLIRQFEKSNVPYLIVHNKSDISKIATYTKIFIRQYTNAKIIDFSTLHPTNKEELIEAIKEIIPENVYQQTSLIGDLVKPKDIVLLITPIDSEAPQGRMILPQNMTIRDALDNHCITIVVKETELEDFLKLNIKPTLAITDSRVFDYVAKILPKKSSNEFQYRICANERRFRPIHKRNIPNSIAERWRQYSYSRKLYSSDKLRRHRAGKNSKIIAAIHGEKIKFFLCIGIIGNAGKQQTLPSSFNVAAA